MKFCLNIKNQYIPYKEEEKIRIIFMIQVSSFWPSIESLYEACILDNKFDVRLIYIEDSSVEKEQMKNTRKFLEESKFPYQVFSEENIKAFKPHIAVYQPPYDLSYRNPDSQSIHLKNMGIRIVHIPYGIEISDTNDARLAHFESFVVRNSWRIYTFSKKMKEEYEKYCGNRFAVRALGIPKFDSYVNKNFRLPDEIINKAKGRKIILWKMHFPKLIYEKGKRVQVTPYLKEYLKFEESLDKYKDFFFIAMLHPMFWSNSISQSLIEESNELVRRLKARENVYIDTDDDYRNSLCNVDGIIIDRSALMVEAAVVNVPILYMYNKDYEEKLTPPVKLLINTFERGNRSKDIELFLDKLVKEEFIDLSYRKEIFQKVISKLDGKNGIRIKNDIKDSLINEKKSKIKLVLFAAGQVCSYYIKYLELKNDERFEIVALSDNSANKWGDKVEGFTIVSPIELKNIDFDLLVIMTEQYYMEIKKKLVYDLYLDEEKIIRLDYFCEIYNNFLKRQYKDIGEK